MKEQLIWDGKNMYYYESYINDKASRDHKEIELKAKWCKEIKTWSYVCATGEIIYFITWK